MVAHQYSQICLTAQEGCDGPGLARTLRGILETIDAGIAVLSDVDLVGSARPTLTVGSSETRTLLIDELLVHLGGTEQIVWATVCLCGNDDQAKLISSDEDYVVSLMKANAMVRVVDATYYYIYGPRAPLARLHRLLGGEMRTCEPSDLDFPE